MKRKNIDYWLPICYIVHGDDMDKRIGKIIVGNVGGTAGKTSKNYKISLPSKWINELDLNNRQVELSFDGEKIIIAPHLNFDDFIKAQKQKNHPLLLMRYYDESTLCTEICADFTDKTLSVRNATDNLVKTAFGKKENPDWEDFQVFLEERCVPRNRSGIREYLEAIGVEEYEPLKIIEKTAGRMAEDNQWLELEEMQ